MLRFQPTGGMIEKAAHRVMSNYIELQRTTKLYKKHLKDTKDPKNLEHDAVFIQLRSDMNLAKANYDGARISLESVKAVQPEAR